VGWARWTAGLGGALLLLAIGVALFSSCSTHGHGDHRLFVSARFVDATDGFPIADGLVFVVKYRSIAEDPERFAWHRADAIAALDDPGEDDRLDEYMVMGYPVTAGRTAADGTVKVKASRMHTVYSWGGLFRTRTNHDPPHMLVVEHPGYGRELFPIDPETPVEGSGWIFSIDLGTIRVARRPPASPEASRRR
jgi:hypothetical protein